MIIRKSPIPSKIDFRTSENSICSVTPFQPKFRGFFPKQFECTIQQVGKDQMLLVSLYNFKSTS